MTTLGLWLMLMWQPSWDYATHFQQVNTDHGLSQSTIWDMVQDPMGFLWIATTSGLNRYDGYKFTVYKADVHNNDGLSDNQIRALAWGGDNALWVGTGFGLNRLDPATNRITRYHADPNNPDGLSFDYITALLPDGQTGMWIGTRDGLNHLNFADGKFTHFRHNPDDPDSLGNNVIRSLMQDHNGRLWVGTNNGLYCQTDNRFLPVTAEEGGLSHRVVRALAASEHAVWAGTTKGLNRIDLKTGEITQHFKGDQPGELPDDWINALTFDREGYLWIGVRDGGLSHMDTATGKCRSFIRDPLRKTTINANDIINIFIDRTNLLWAGSFTHGLSKLNLNPRKFNSYDFKREDGDRVREVQALHQDQQQRLWIGMQKGLLRVDDPNQPARLYLSDGSPGSLSENQILSINEGPKNNLWVGTYAGGLNRYVPQSDSFIHYGQDTEGGVSHRTVFELAVDDRKRMWVGTRAGLDLYHQQTDRFVHIPYPDEDSLRQRETGIYAIHVDEKNVLWLGTDGGGLCRFNPETGDFKRYRDLRNNSNDTADDGIYSITRLKNDIWIGSVSGLIRLDRTTDTLIPYNQIRALDNAAVFSVTSDERHMLWLSTSKGVFNFNPNQGEGYRQFNISDGLESTDFFKNTALKRNDEILFGGIHGLNGFFTREITTQVEPARVVLTSFKVMGRETAGSDRIAYMDRVELDHSQKMFSFEFASLDFRAPAKNRFAYKMEGFDQSWRDAGSRHFVDYSNLPGGRYTFQVKALNQPDQMVSIPVFVSPPFWQTGQFRLLVVFLLMAFALSAHYYRAWKIRRSNEELEALVNQRSRELEDARQELVDMAHRTGIYEIADGVLRQIVQQIRDVEEAIKSIRELARDSVVPSFVESNKQLQQQLAGQDTGLLMNFTTQYAGFIDQFEEERQQIHHKTLKLVQKADTMKDTISVQHAYAKTPLYTQEVYVREMINDALKLESVDLSNLGVKIRKHFRADPQYKTAKVKLMQVLTQVLQNSIDALKTKGAPEKVITIEVTRDEEEVIRIRIEDNGCGMTSEELEKAFNAGFSHWEGHPGLGLHEAVNAMRETGNDLLIDSKGPNQGAAVTLVLR